MLSHSNSEKPASSVNIQPADAQTKVQERPKRMRPKLSVANAAFIPR